MKKYVLLFILIIYGSAQAYSQIGVDVMYNFNKYNNWEEVEYTEGLFKKGFGVGIDYWFKPIEQRMEMTVGISYGSYSTSTSGSLSSEITYKLEEIKLNVKNNFYMFSFNDCNTCPDFNKKGDVFKKGLFLQTILGVGYNIYDVLTLYPGNDFKTNDISYNLGAGIGFDIRLTNKMIITPYFNYIKSISNTYRYITIRDPYLNQDSDRSSLVFGIRLGLTKKKNSWE